MENEQSEKPKTNRTEYMREYKRKKYAENPDAIKAKNKAYYYKYKCDLPSEYMERYSTLLPYVAKLRKEVEEFKTKDLDKCIEVIETILYELRTNLPI